MALSVNTRLLIDFDETTPIDQVSGSPLNVYGTFVSTVGQFGSALQMTETTYYDIDSLDSLTNQFTIGFWLNSINPGMITNPTTNVTQPLKMALFNKSNLSYSSVTNLTTSTSDMFSIWEETQSDGTNKMKIELNNSAVVLTSSSYTVGTFHHFWIVYNGSGYLSIYIDGALDTGSSLSGSIPATLTASTQYFGINKGINGYGYETARNLGVLDDLVVYSLYDTSKTDIFRTIDLGAVYVADTTLQNENEVSFGSVFNDTSTIQVNSVCGNSGNVYVGRSDGLLLKGVRTLWTSRRDFSNIDEINYLTVITKSTTDNYTIQNGILTVTNAIMRI